MPALVIATWHPAPRSASKSRVEARVHDAHRALDRFRASLEAPLPPAVIARAIAALEASSIEVPPAHPLTPRVHVLVRRLRENRQTLLDSLTAARP